MPEETIVITDLRQLTQMQMQAILDKVVIKGEGIFKPPPLDLAAIKARAEELDPKSQLKADIYMLLIEIDRLKNGV